MQSSTRKTKPHVALRKESVDRNYSTVGRVNTDNMSLSARRAWIEIAVAEIAKYSVKVALRKESVDRNCCEV